MSRLPAEALRRVLALCGPGALQYSLPLVCRAWRDLAASAELWRLVDLDLRDGKDDAALLAAHARGVRSVRRLHLRPRLPAALRAAVRDMRVSAVLH